MDFELDKYQKNAAYYYGPYPLLIEAGAGAGKTSVMIERVRFLLEDKKVDPESILICTFSNLAAERLRNKLIDAALSSNSNISKNDIYKMQISTIHSFCIELLNQKGYDFRVIGDETGELKTMFIYDNKEHLGFLGPSYVSGSKCSIIAQKYDEFLTFNLKQNQAEDYVKNNFPVKEDFIKLIDEYSGKGFPYDIISNDKKLKDESMGYSEDWYNSQFNQVINSFPKYIKLLEKNRLMDFSYIQSKALEVLRKEPHTKYKHIFVDEFQDTDPIQAEIFQILIKNALKGNDEDIINGTFTAVGDRNQNIYGFRGASKNYFDEFIKWRVSKRLKLKYNYRSTKDIVDLSEDFINKQRENCSSSVEAFKNIHRPAFYLNSLDQKEEAINIANLIKYLVDSGKANYNDFLILSRKAKSRTLKLINELNKNNIPFNAKGVGNLKDRDEIKSIITMIHFIVQSDEDGEVPIRSRFEKDWLNIKAFTGEKFNQKLCNLSDETKAILSNIQEEYENEVISVAYTVQENHGVSKRKKFNTILDNNTSEVLSEIFENIQKPKITLDFLKSKGVTNEDDLEFFKKLNDLRDEYQNKDFDDRDNILTFYYKILNLNNYLTEEFIMNPQNEEEIKNIAMLTNTIYNYENMISKNNLNGLYWYLSSNLDNYSTATSETEGIQIMNVHQAKGLEFPITILLSLKEDDFPMKYRDELTLSTYQAPYYIPNEYMEFKNEQSEDEINHIDEEERVIYVAMTRAEDTLILSNVEKINNRMKDDEREEASNTLKSRLESFIPICIQRLINNNPNILKELNEDNFDEIEAVTKHSKPPEPLKLGLSFSSIDSYSSCSLAYHLKKDFGFKLSNSEFINYGNIIHNSLEQINKKVLNGDSLTEKDIILNVIDIYDNYPNSPQDAFIKQEIIENVLDYWNNFGSKIKILESEYPFSVFRSDYILSGAIDLIYETEDGNLGIIDYKNAINISEFKKEKYTKQIHTYILGLKEDPNYQDMEVTEAYVYGTYIKKLIKIDLEWDVDPETNIINTSNNIHEGKFKSNKGRHCEWCKFNFICLNKVCPNCGKYIADYYDYCNDCQKEIDSLK